MSNDKINWNKVEEKFSEEQGLPFSEALSEQEIREVLEKENVKFRKRVFSPVIVIWAFLSQIMDGDSSCRKTAARILAFLVAQGEKIYSASRSGYCRAKGRIKVSVLKHLVHKVGQEAIDQVQPDVICLGYDQAPDFKSPSSDIKIIRINAYHPEKYKSSLL